MGNFVVKERMVRDTRRGGFTLMELMVYIAILGIVVIVAGQAFSNSAKSRIRTQSMLKASEVAENVASIFKTDVSQTGAKSSLETRGLNGGNDQFSEVHETVYMDPENEDMSSFSFVPASPASNENLQQFKMRRVRYDSDGKYQAVEQITWFLDDKTLKRQCVVIEGAAGEDCAPSGTADDALTPFTVEMATGVEKFQVLPAIPWKKADAPEGSDEYLVFPDASGAFRFVQRYDASKKIQPLSVGEGGTSVTLKNFAMNYQENEISGTSTDDVSTTTEKNRNEVYVFTNTVSDASWSTLCENSPIHLDSAVTYELSFNISSPSGTLSKELKSFIPNKDHMAVGFWNTEGEIIAGLDDFIFFPPMEENAKDIERKMRFSIKRPVNACMVFTFSYFSPVAATAPVEISNLKLRVAESSVYKFDENVTSVNTKYKKNVKAFMLKLQIKCNGESGEATLVVPTPSNGPTD